MMLSMGKRRIKLSDQIRREIKGCGMSRYRLSKLTGIRQETFSRFMSGERGLPMKTLDVLADFLGLDVVKRPRKGRKG